ncbi:MAG: hypothetical protein WC538_20420 [Thermoanaerobaculia bacterium]|jgi:hypothetical protein
MHLTRDAIRSMLTGSDGGPMSKHLFACPTCSAVADEVAFDLGMCEPLAWELAALPELPRVEPSLAFDSWLHERLASGVAVAEFLREPRIASEEGLLALLRAAHALLNVDPVRLRELADGVLDVTELPEAKSDAVVVVALREKANALRRIGELPECLATIARGREAAMRLVVSEHELAIFDYIEALVCLDQSAVDRARTLGTRALAVFSRFGDTRRELYVRQLLGFVEHVTGSLAVARDVYRSIAPGLAALGDSAGAAGAIQNAGTCSAELGELVSARAEIEDAALRYAELGLTTESLRARWALAHVALRESRDAGAERELAAIADALEVHGLSLDAALARLDLVELYRRTDRGGIAAELVRSVASVFAAAGARGQLAEAMTLLRDAAENGTTLDEPLRIAREAVTLQLTQAN